MVATTFYKEVAIDNIRNRGTVMAVPLIPSAVENATGEMYNSYYSFDEEVLSHFNKRKSITGYVGNFYLENPIIDIDKGDNTDEFTLEKVRRFLDRLKQDFDLYPQSCNLFFSGRGYHIELPDIFHFTPSKNLPLLVKSTLEKYMPEGDSIYDYARIIRTNNTLNIKSGLYKIELTADEIYSLSVDKIHNLAKNRRYLNKFLIEDIDEEYTTPDHSSLVVLEEKELATAIKNPAQETTEIATCIQKMYLEGPIEGHRHHKILRMVTSWRRSGLPLQAAIAAAQNWADNMDAYEVKRAVLDIYSKAYHPYKCSDSLMTKYCDSKCIFYKNKNFTVNTIDAEEAQEAFANFLNNTGKSFDLKRMYNLTTSYKFTAGEVIQIIGDTKLGKSTILQNWCIDLPDRKILYLPLENGVPLTFRRFMQIAHGLSPEETNQIFKEVNERSKKLASAMSHISIVDTAPTLESLQKLIIQHKPDIVVVDTLDALSVPIADETQRTNHIASTLKELALKHNVIIFAVVHISKSAAVDSNGKAKKMTVHANKGSSSIPQKFDKTLAWEGVRKDRQRFLTSLAARDDGDLNLTFYFEWETFRMTILGV